MSKYTNIKKYLEYLMLPNSKIGGHAICPFLKQYFDSIKYTTYTSKIDVYQSIPKIVADKLPAQVIVCNFNWDWYEMDTVLNVLHHLYKANDIEFLFMHPQSEDPALPIINYAYYKPLIIVQVRSLLHQARKQLAQNTNYYDYFTQVK